MGNAPARRDTRAGRLWPRVVLALILGFFALIGVWYLGVRPALHHQALMQFNRAWNEAEAEVFQYLSIFPERQRKSLLFNEKFLDHALNTSDTDSVQNWQVTVTPANIRLSFTSCGQNCTVTAVLEVNNDRQIQVTSVQVQGIFALILSDSELMDALRNHLQIFNQNIVVTRITLLEHAISVQLY